MHAHGRATRAHGFTLIEMIGVMAIMAILASAIMPGMIQSVMRERADQETTSLATLSADLQRYILTHQAIPSPASSAWTSALSSVSHLPAERIEFNENGYRRALYVDPRFFTATDTSFSGYTQQHGNVTVVSPRVMLVSNLQANAAAAPTTHSAFDAIWDQTSAASVVENENVKIERINLSRYFHRLILSNESSSDDPTYTLGSSASQSVSNAASPVSLTIIENTQVELFDSLLSGAGSEFLFIQKSAASYRYASNGTDWDWTQP